MKMNKTLRCKKGIGIFAIIFGLLRFGSGSGLIGDLAQLENKIQQYYKMPYINQSKLSELEKLVSITWAYLPFAMITTLAIFVLGIVLLSNEKGIPNICHDLNHAK
jgi:hypothetical protein